MKNVAVVLVVVAVVLDIERSRFELSRFGETVVGNQNQSPPSSA